MNEETTQPLTAFEQRVLNEFAGIRQEIAKINSRLDRLESKSDIIESRLSRVEDKVDISNVRLTKLEDKVDARLRETRPIWEGVLLKLTEIEKALKAIQIQMRQLAFDSVDLRGRVSQLEQNELERERTPAV
ncbi:MAG: hypothetical protein MSG64_12305 [Pyrinomonadaceae bacterium MAG19_C2-C3]|nr:hypothetical protein [Pyrinomonadaceae bacterium MAG19_C2-C3]